MTNDELRKTLAEASRVFILTDENVARLWLAELKHWLKADDAIELIVKPGEENKTLQTAQTLWIELMRHGADRHSILVNFGGGVITDLGGFVASCYQRGIRFVNIPTTLLAMVDAAVGGKTGVDIDGCKNQIGTFAQPIEIVVNPICLSTLPDREFLSGLAEMLKYGYIADPSMLKVDLDNYEQYVLRGSRIKKEIVDGDYKEQGRRKVLNFGHTLGHAYESFSRTTATPLTHGESIALGMWSALWLSVKLCGLPEDVLVKYQPKLKVLLSMTKCAFDEKDVDSILDFLTHDKKNRDGQTRWVLLPKLGSPSYDVVVPKEMVRQCVLETIATLKEL